MKQKKTKKSFQDYSDDELLGKFQDLAVDARDEQLSEKEQALPEAEKVEEDPDEDLADPDLAEFDDLIANRRSRPSYMGSYIEAGGRNVNRKRSFENSESLEDDIQAEIERAENERGDTNFEEEDL